MRCSVCLTASQGWTPLGLAAKARNVEMVKYLLENKAEPNVSPNTLQIHPECAAAHARQALLSQTPIAHAAHCAASGRDGMGLG